MTYSQRNYNVNAEQLMGPDQVNDCYFLPNRVILTKLGHYIKSERIMR